MKIHSSSSTSKEAANGRASLEVERAEEKWTQDGSPSGKTCSEAEVYDSIIVVDVRLHSYDVYLDDDPCFELRGSTAYTRGCEGWTWWQ